MANPKQQWLQAFTGGFVATLLFHQGVLVGWSSSGGYGSPVGKSIGYGYIRTDGGVDEAYVDTGTYELEVATERVPATVFLKPLYDPSMSRVKA